MEIIKVDIPLETPDCQGLSTNDMLRVKEVWKKGDSIMLKIDGIAEPQEIGEYEECIPQIYKYLSELETAKTLQKCNNN